MTRKSPKTGGVTRAKPLVTEENVDIIWSMMVRFYHIGSFFFFTRGNGCFDLVLMQRRFQNLLISGVTGECGSTFVLKLLQNKHVSPKSLILLARSKTEDDARQRIFQKLSHVSTQVQRYGILQVASIDLEHCLNQATVIPTGLETCDKVFLDYKKPISEVLS